MCKHIIMACLGVGIIHFILETTLFRCCTSPQVKCLSDIPESTSHSVHFSSTFTKCTGSATQSGKHYPNHDALCISISQGEVSHGIQLMELVNNTQNNISKWKLTLISALLTSLWIPKLFWVPMLCTWVSIIAKCIRIQGYAHGLL